MSSKFIKLSLMRHDVVLLIDTGCFLYNGLLRFGWQDWNFNTEAGFDLLAYTGRYHIPSFTWWQKAGRQQQQHNTWAVPAAVKVVYISKRTFTAELLKSEKKMSNSNYYSLTTGLELGDIETHVLKVNINCQGCKRRVKKLLRKIEGVFSVHVDEEHQVVKVTGKVDPTKLIKKLIKFGKHAEFWSPNKHLEFIGENKMDQMQYLRINGIDNPQTEHGSTTFGYDVEADSRKYVGYNIGCNSMTGKAGQSFVDEAKLQRMGEEGNTFAKTGYGISMFDPAVFGGNNGAGFVGLRPHESGAAGFVSLRPHKFGMFHEVPSSLTTYDYNHPNLPSMIETSLQGYHHSNPAAHMNPCIQDENSNNHMNTMFSYDNKHM